MQQNEENMPILDNGGVQQEYITFGREIIRICKRTQHDLNSAKGREGKTEFCCYYAPIRRGHKYCHCNFLHATIRKWDDKPTWNNNDLANDVITRTSLVELMRKNPGNSVNRSLLAVQLLSVVAHPTETKPTFSTRMLQKGKNPKFYTALERVFSCLLLFPNSKECIKLLWDEW